jgi:hypothetical protein
VFFHDQCALYEPSHQFGGPNFLKLGIVGKFEDVLKRLHAFFFHNQKTIHKYVELINTVETNLKNTKTCWISMSLTIKKFLYEYHDLVLKMHQDVDTINQVAHNLELLCDLEVMLGISCIVPMLEQFNDLIKFSHFW